MTWRMPACRETNCSHHTAYNYTTNIRLHVNDKERPLSLSIQKIMLLGLFDKYHGQWPFPENEADLNVLSENVPSKLSENH